MSEYRPLVLVGAGGLAREVLSALHSAGRRADAVLDDDTSLVGSRLHDTPVTGTLATAVEHQDAEFVICVGSGTSRRKVLSQLEREGIGPDRYASLVHPTASIGSGCTVGRGSVMLAGVVLTADVVVGGHVVVMPNVVLTHDDVIEDFATLCAGVVLGGGVRVRTGAYIGMNAAVRQNICVGTGATLGMGAVLTRDMPAGTTWAGVPARPLVSTEAGRRRPVDNGFAPRTEAAIFATVDGDQ